MKKRFFYEAHRFLKGPFILGIPIFEWGTEMHWDAYLKSDWGLQEKLKQGEFPAGAGVQVQTESE